MAENEKPAESDSETPAAKPEPAARPAKPKKAKPAPAPAERFSPFGALAKLLTEEERAKLTPAPEKPAITVESGRRDERRGGRDERRGFRDDRGNRGGERRDERRGPPAGERRDGARRFEGRRDEGKRDPRGERRGPPRGRPERPGEHGGPKLEQVVASAEKSGMQEAVFAQTLLHALTSEVDRFCAALGNIEGLDAGLRKVTEEQMRRLLEHAHAPLNKTIDGEAPIVIGVTGGPKVGKSTLIEALAGDAGSEVTKDENGRSATLWRGIKFFEMPTHETVDGVVELRMEGIEHHHEGRPLLVLENLRLDLHDGFAFEKFMKDPDAMLGPENPHDDFDAVPKVHLLAFNLATQPAFKNRGARLREISRFRVVEQLLARRLHSRARLLRTQRFIDDLIDAIVPLRDFALTVNLQSHVEAKAWQSRLAETTAALAKWGDEMRASLKGNAALPFASLRSQLDAFANKHAGDRQADELWAKRLASLWLTAHEEAEFNRVWESYRQTANAILERTKAARQPGEGPLPQPVLMTTVPPIFRETTNAFRQRLTAVIDPLQWVTKPVAAEKTIAEPESLPADRDRMLAAMNRRLDQIERRLAEDLQAKFVASILAPVDRRLNAESRTILDALFNLGREGHMVLAVVNEVLLSLVQRLVERAADNFHIKLPLIQKMVREPGHRTKLLVPPSRDLFMLARRLQDALGERIDMVPAVEENEARVAAALLPAKIKPELVKINEEKRMAQVKVPRNESGKAFGRNGSNQRLAASLVGYHLHLRIAKDKDLQEAAAAADAKRNARRKTAKPAPEVTPAPQAAPEAAPAEPAADKPAE